MRREYGKFDTLQNKKIFTNHTIRYCDTKKRPIEWSTLNLTRSLGHKPIYYDVNSSKMRCHLKKEKRNSHHRFRNEINQKLQLESYNIQELPSFSKQYFTKCDRYS